MTANFIRGAIIAMASLAMASCASVDRSYGLDDSISITSLTELPAPETTAPRFAPMSVVEVTVAQDETLNGTYVIDEAGMLDFPLIGEVAAAGLSSTQLASVIRNRLSGAYVVDPSVTVSSVNAIPPSVSIGGQVKAPGSYPIANATTLMRAVNSAGGFADYAREDDVLVFREVGGERYIGLYNLSAINRGNYPDPSLYPGDIVMVGDNPSERRLERILQILPAISSSIVLLDRVAR